MDPFYLIPFLLKNKTECFRAGAQTFLVLKTADERPKFCC